MLSFFVIGVLTIVFSCHLLLNPNTGQLNFYQWYSHFFSAVQNHHFLNISITVVIVIATSLILNSTFNKTSFYLKTSALPALIYILLASTWQSYGFNSATIIDLILAFAVLKITELDQNHSAIHIGFITGLIIGSSFIISPWMSFTGVFVFLAINTFRPFIWREWALTVLGLILPFSYLVGIKYIALGEVAIKTLQIESQIGQFETLDYVSFGLLGVMVLNGLFSLMKYYSTVTIVQRKQLNMFFQLLVLCMIITVSLFVYNGTFVSFFNVPLCILMTVHVVNIKRIRLLEILIIALLIINLLRIFIE